MLKRSFSREALISIGGNCIAALLGFATGALSARLLGPVGRGELSAIQTWATFIATMATLGLPEALVYFCARKPREAKNYIITAVITGLVGCLPLLALCYVAMPLLLSAQAVRVVSAARWYLFLVVFYIGAGAPLGALRGLGHFTTWTILRLLLPGLWLVALLIGWTIRRSTPEFLALLNLSILSAIGTPTVLYFVYRRLPESLPIQFGDWRPLLRFGVPSAASGLPQSLNLRLDQMLMAALLPPKLLGLYAVAVAWSGMSAPLIQGVSAVFFPHLAAYQNQDERFRSFAGVIRLMAPLSFLFAVVLAVATPAVLPLIFGRSFVDAVPSAVILVFAGAILNLNLLIEEGFRGLGTPIALVWAELGGLVVTGLGLACLLEPMGIIGAAFASIIGYSAVNILLVVQARSITGYSFTDMLVPSRAAMRLGWARVRAVAWEE